jgi:L-lactate utilization protein LutB
MHSAAALHAVCAKAGVARGVCRAAVECILTNAAMTNLHAAWWPLLRKAVSQLAHTCHMCAHCNACNEVAKVALEIDEHIQQAHLNLTTQARLSFVHPAGTCEFDECVRQAHT